MKYILSFTLFALLLISCANTKKVNNNTSSSENNAFKNMAKDDSLFASIRRGACFGSCPTFEINIYNSGYAELKGTRAVDLIGDYTATISKAKMQALLDMANNIGYQKMDDVYDNPMVTDLPETETSIVINGKRKSVRRRVNFPTEILKLEELFDLLLKSEKWTKVDNPKDSAE